VVRSGALPCSVEARGVVADDVHKLMKFHVGKCSGGRTGESTRGCTRGGVGGALGSVHIRAGVVNDFAGEQHQSHRRRCNRQAVSVFTKCPRITDHVAVAALKSTDTVGGADKTGAAGSLPLLWITTSIGCGCTDGSVRTVEGVGQMARGDDQDERDEYCFHTENTTTQKFSDCNRVSSLLGMETILARLSYYRRCL